VENSVIYDLRKKSFEKLQNLSLSYYDQNAVGQIMSRVVADISRLGSNVAWNLVDMFWGNRR
jgi:ATP-binding cassette subfamily B protein